MQVKHRADRLLKVARIVCTRFSGFIAHAASSLFLLCVGQEGDRDWYAANVSLRSQLDAWHMVVAGSWFLCLEGMVGRGDSGSSEYDGPELPLLTLFAWLFYLQMTPLTTHKLGIDP